MKILDLIEGLTGHIVEIDIRYFALARKIKGRQEVVFLDFHPLMVAQHICCVKPLYNRGRDAASCGCTSTILYLRGSGALQQGSFSICIKN